MHATTVLTPSNKSAFRLAMAALLASLATPMAWAEPVTNVTKAASAPTAQSTTNLGTIMPLGDSMTAGVSAGGYRDPLCALLKNAGYTFKFVGSLTDNPTEALTAAGQDHHEGHNDAGAGIGMVNIRWINEHLGEYLSNNAPDRILLTIGAHDMRGSDMRTQFEQMNRLVNNIFTLRPTVKLYVSSVPPQAPGPVVRVIESFNKTIQGIVANHRTKGRDVVFVSLDAINPATDLAGYMNPGRKGCQKMAQAWYDALVKP